MKRLINYLFVLFLVANQRFALMSIFPEPALMRFYQRGYNKGPALRAVNLMRNRQGECDPLDASPTEPQDPCPPGWRKFKNHCYFSKPNQQLTWIQARQKCNQDDAELVSVMNREEREFLTWKLKATRCGPVWIGLNDLTTEGDFKWTDGSLSQSSLIEWSSNEPNDPGRRENCVEMYHSGLFNDLYCTKKRPYVCKRTLAGRKQPDVYGSLLSPVQETQQARPNCEVQPLGLENGDIPDASITASIYKEYYCPPEAGRLGYQGNLIKHGAWNPKTSRQGEWLQVDLGKRTKVDAIATQGSHTSKKWTQSYSLRHSDDGRSFKDYKNGKIFVGNTDQNSIVSHYLEPAITARYVRLLPKAWHTFIAIRMELYRSCSRGSLSCKALGMQSSDIPDRSISASSSYHTTYPPKDARLNNKYKAQSRVGSWGCGTMIFPVRDWIQVDLGKVTIVTGLATQGSPIGADVQWITSYILKYSNDSTVFHDYLYARRLNGNRDQTTIVKHDLHPPIVARYVRLYPITWHGMAGLRMELYGCKQESAPKTAAPTVATHDVPRSGNKNIVKVRRLGELIGL